MKIFNYTITLGNCHERIPQGRFNQTGWNVIENTLNNENTIIAKTKNELGDERLGLVVKHTKDGIIMKLFSDIVNMLKTNNPVLNARPKLYSGAFVVGKSKELIDKGEICCSCIKE